MKKRIIWLLVIGVLIGGWGYSYYKNISKNNSAKTSAFKKIDDEYDVIVIGGEPEGVASAVSAARNGAKTLLVEKREELGGLFTYGMLNFLDIPQGESGESVSKGIFEEWHSLVGGGSAFDIHEAKKAFKKLIDENENITLLTETEVLDVISENNTICEIKIKNKNEEFKVKGKTFIDATQDADFSVMAGVPYYLGGEDIGIKNKKMSVTLMIHLKNVDWVKIRETAKSEKFGKAEVTESVAWGFSDLHHVYKPVEDNTRLRGLNLAKIGDKYYINALQIFGVDGLDMKSKQAAIAKGKRETKHILNFLREEFPGFENAEIASFPTELYVRETRHIKSEYQLPMSDIWTNKDHWDNIGYGAYPVDIQAQTPQDYGYIVANPNQYAIPFRTLVPINIDGLLVVGRSTGYSSLAAGSARVVPTGMTTGEAAGAAAALAVEKNVTFREMSKQKALIHILRETLENQGAFVKHTNLDYPYKDEWYDGAIQRLINYGLIFGRYDNDLKVEENATIHSFMAILYDGIQRANPDEFMKINNRINEVNTQIFNNEDVQIKRDVAADIITKILFENTTSTNSWQTLIEKGLVDEDLNSRINNDRELKTKEIFAICAAVINYIEKC